MDIRHTWDAGGNLYQREDVLASETETFGYDFLDRLISASGAYSASYTYNQIGNILTRNGVSYSYDSTQPHAVDTVGQTGYYYDNNGNMTTRGSQTIAWDAENRPVSVSDNGSTTTFVYDGDGNRVKKIEGGEIILYINRYYEKNLTTGDITTYFYLGDRLVAMRQGSANISYIHQDHLTGTSLVTSANGTLLGIIKYYPYGSTRSGSVPTDKQFTGQRLDGTGLYYYNARYYDPQMGRFISPDTLVPDPTNPQSFNRYSYVLNNPLKYVDPSGHRIDFYDPVLDLLNDFNQYGLGFILPSHVFGNLIALYNAWTTYSEAAPDAATRLESADELITIKWASLERAEGDFNPVGDGNYEILLDNELIDKDPRRAVVSLAHESFHVLTRMDNPGLGVTRYEETIAWSYGYWVGEERGYEHATASLFRDITPHVPGTGYLPITEFEERVVRGIRLFEALKWYEGMTPGSRTNLKQLQITAFTYWPW